jgi:hypothetical protein
MAKSSSNHGMVTQGVAPSHTTARMLNISVGGWLALPREARRRGYCTI